VKIVPGSGGEAIMTMRLVRALSLPAALAAAVLAAHPAPVAAYGIKCDKGNQLVQGNLIASPYCEDEYLAVVAREYGFAATGKRLRNDPIFKKQICQYVFNDIRVQVTCLNAGVPEIFAR
jgi:hypothetical protein